MSWCVPWQHISICWQRQTDKEHSVGWIYSRCLCLASPHWHRPSDCPSMPGWFPQPAVINKKKNRRRQKEEDIFRPFCTFHWVNRGYLCALFGKQDIHIQQVKAKKKKNSWNTRKSHCLQQKKQTNCYKFSNKQTPSTQAEYVHMVQRHMVVYILPTTIGLTA